MLWDACVWLSFSLILLPGCSSPAEESKPRAQPEMAEAREVVLKPVETRELQRSLIVTGTLAADERVVLSTQVDGRVQSMLVDLGSSVQQGDPIASLDTTDYRLRVEQASSLLAQARARLGLDVQGTSSEVVIDQTSLVKEAQATFEEASANLERSRALVERRLVARADFDTANAAYLRAQTGVENAREEIRNRLAMLRQRRSEVELAKKQLADATVRAPFSGMVEARQAGVGQYLSVGAPVATLVRIDPLRLRAEVPERDAGSIRTGQRVTFAIDGQEALFEGRVARISPILAEQSRTLLVEAEIRNPGNLRPGSFTRAEIVQDGAEKALVVPLSALVTFAGVDKVLTVDADRVVEKRVVTGRRGAAASGPVRAAEVEGRAAAREPEQDYVEILSGLLAEERVIAEPGNLQQGALVRVREH